MSTLLVDDDGRYNAIKHGNGIRINISGMQPVAVTPQEFQQAVDVAEANPDTARFDIDTKVASAENTTSD